MTQLAESVLVSGAMGVLQQRNLLSFANSRGLWHCVMAVLVHLLNFIIFVRGDGLLCVSLHDKRSIFSSPIVLGVGCIEFLLDHAVLCQVVLNFVCM